DRPSARVGGPHLPSPRRHADPARGELPPPRGRRGLRKPGGGARRLRRRVRRDDRVRPGLGGRGSVRRPRRPDPDPRGRAELEGPPATGRGPRRGPAILHAVEPGVLSLRRGGHGREPRAGRGESRARLDRGRGPVIARAAGAAALAGALLLAPAVLSPVSAVSAVSPPRATANGKVA